MAGVLLFSRFKAKAHGLYGGAMIEAQCWVRLLAVAIYYQGVSGVVRAQGSHRSPSPYNEPVQGITIMGSH